METVLQAKNMTKIYGMGSKQPFTALENIDLKQESLLLLWDRQVPVNLL